MKEKMTNGSGFLFLFLVDGFVSLFIVILN